MDRLMTIDDVAAYLGVTRRTLYNWRNAGTGPTASRVGNRLRWRREDVDVWVLQRQRRM